MRSRQARAPKNLAKRKAFEEQRPTSIRELVFERELLDAAPELEKVFQERKERFETTTHRKQRARDARCGIANDYHPFDLSTGVPLESREWKSSAPATPKRLALQVRI